MIFLTEKIVFQNILFNENTKGPQGILIHIRQKIYLPGAQKIYFSFAALLFVALALAAGFAGLAASVTFLFLLVGLVFPNEPLLIFPFFERLSPFPMWFGIIFRFGSALRSDVAIPLALPVFSKAFFSHLS